MNLELLDPFAKTVPDHVDSVLSYGVEDATVCCFDKRGAYLAVGYATGIVVIWDFVTRGIGRVIEAHARGITALSWARGGRRLLSASHDQRLHYWALEPARPELIRVICLDSPIMSALMLPGKYPRALALTADGVSHLVDIKENVTKAVCFTDRTIVSPPATAAAAGNPSPAKKARSSSWTEQPAAPSNGSTGVASGMPAVLCLALDRRAPRVCLGTSSGQVLSVGTSNGEVSRSMAVVGCSKVKQLDLSRDGKWMLVNAGEKVIRMLERESTTGRSVRDFQDVVNRTRWQCCRFTGDSEYIAGGSRAEAACSIYIWTVEGHLVTRLDGPNLGLLHLMRHPVRPFLAAALTNGKVQLWGTTPTANWTAFAADFEELEESVEYVEKEDEFDVVVDSADPQGHKRKAEKEHEDDEVVVSIEAVHGVDAWSSDSEQEGPRRDLFYLSTEPGAAAREGWYDLEVQTSKKGLSSEPGDGRWDDKEEWTTVRVGGAGEAGENGDRGGAGKKGGSKKRRHGGGRREVAKKRGSLAGKSQSEADKTKAGDGSVVGGGGSGGEGGEGAGRDGGTGKAAAEGSSGAGTGTGADGQPERPAPSAPLDGVAPPSVRPNEAAGSNAVNDGVGVTGPPGGGGGVSSGDGAGGGGGGGDDREGKKLEQADALRG